MSDERIQQDHEHVSGCCLRPFDPTADPAWKAWVHSARELVASGVPDDQIEPFKAGETVAKVKSN